MGSRATSSHPPGIGATAARLTRVYLRGHWSVLLLGLLAMLATDAMNGLLAWGLGPATSLIFVDKRADLLLLLAAAAFGVMFFRAVFFFLGKSMIDGLAEKVAAACQRDMFASLARHDLAALNAVHSGQFVSNFLYDYTLLRDAVSLGLAAVGIEIVQLLIYTGIIVHSDWQLGLLALLIVPAVAWVMGKLGRSMRRAATRGMEETGALATALSEAMDGRRIVKAYGLEDHMIQRVQASIDTRLKSLIKAVRARAAAVPATDILLGVVVALVVLSAGYQSIYGTLTLAHFVSFTGALLLAQQPVRNLSQYWPVAVAGAAAANRAFAIIDAHPLVADRADAGTLQVARNGGAVRFEDVRFAYQDSDAALDGVTLETAPGTKVALVGPSGAGKSTLFNLLLRFYDVDGGRITIDGQDIRDVTLASLRAGIALVTQETILFDESISDNIALGRPGAGQAAVEAAARDAAAHDFIMELPEGYATRVGEGGLKLSGGQRQRIAIARALLKNAPILLLDEATSALDTTSERQVQEALSRLMAGRTTIVIAHRLSTVLDAACIYVLDKGRVAETGTHAELLAAGGLYASLYRLGFDEAAG